jgi:predicted aspartyl protease
LQFKAGSTSTTLPGVARRENHLVVPLRINGGSEQLLFLFDTGAGRTVLDRRFAERLGLKSTGKSSISGVGSGSEDVDVIKDVLFQIGDVRLAGVTLNLVTDVHSTDGTVGIIGYDLLCGAAVTLDYQKPSIVITAPTAFEYHGSGDVLPLTFKGKWPYTRGTLKVPGVDSVTDDFLIDTGSEDAVNHPIIRKSKGELHQTRTGAGGVGNPLAGVIGVNEWFRIGSTKISATQSVCCSGNPDVDNQLGGAILSRFRITFNYPAAKVIFEKN